MQATALIGRLLMSAIFVVSGLGKIFTYSAQVGYVASMGVPVPTVGIVVAAIVELAGALGLITGFRLRLTAWLLFLYLVPVTLIFHTDFADQNQMIHFLKNLGLMGGFLILAGHSADSRPAPEQP